MDGLFSMSVIRVIVEDVHYQLSIFFGEDPFEVGETVYIFRFIRGAVESDTLVLDAAAHEIAFTAFKQIVHPLVLQADLLTGGFAIPD